MKIRVPKRSPGISNSIGHEPTFRMTFLFPFSVPWRTLCPTL